MLSLLFSFVLQGIENCFKSTSSECCSCSGISPSSHLQSLESDPDSRGSTARSGKSPVRELGNNFNSGTQEWGTSNYNTLEGKLQKLNIADYYDDVPPRFRKSPWGKTFRMHSKQKQFVNHRQLKEGVCGNFVNENANHMDLQQPCGTACTKEEHETPDIWHEWESSVVVRGGVDGNDAKKLALVEDNDDLNDVLVSQYISSLYQAKKGTALAEHDSGKISPGLIQKLNNLKSTTNADSHKSLPATTPNPPKGPDRWGGTELNHIETPTGWGDIPDEHQGNWYDDGVLLWTNSSMPYGAGAAWSWNS